MFKAYLENRPPLFLKTIARPTFILFIEINIFLKILTSTHDQSSFIIKKENKYE